MIETIHKILEKHLIPRSFYIYGFADLTGLLNDKFKGFDYGISIGMRLNNRIVDSIIDGPTPEYYEHYREVNASLAKLTENISGDLIKAGIESMNIEPTIPTGELDTKYYRTLRTELSHKMVATRAGLGWIGKTDLFISRETGPRLRLVTILVNTPLKSVSGPVNKSKCGNCNLCVEICPADAANGKLWDISVDREEFFNPWKCREQCAEFGRTRLGRDARICGICVSVCPIGDRSN
jgi:epoxyqueuosine reductase QueG